MHAWEGAPDSDGRAAGGYPSRVAPGDTVSKATPARRPPQSAILAGVGLVWLGVALGEGPIAFLLAVVPGGLLLASALACFSMGDDARTRHMGALGGALGVLLTVPLLFAVGPGLGLVLGGLAALAFVAEGWMSLRRTPKFDDVPEAPEGIGYAAQIAGDDAILAWMVQSLNIPTAGDHPRIAREIEDARVLYGERGWLEKPADFHEAPPPPDGAVLSPASFAGQAYDHLRFESGYEPRLEEPGRDRWLARSANRTAHAWILRHSGEPRPWLVCIAGYQMGVPWMDFPAFDVKRLHRERGLNVAIPVLPLHGPRKVGRISGEHYMGAEFLDTVHAEAQAMWDIRRLLHWIRSEGGETIGAYGLSLGGYNTALLAALDGGLACAIAGIPPTDFARLVWRHGPPRDVLAAYQAKLDREAVDQVLRVVSPLALLPQVPKEHRAIFGAIGDQLVPADQVRDLWRHWDQPEIAWYEGAHMTFGLHGRVSGLIDRTLRAAGISA